MKIPNPLYLPLTITFVAAIFVYVNLNKVVTAAKRSERTLKTLCILKHSVTAKLCKIKSLASSIPDVSAAGNIVCRLVDLRKIDVDIAEVHRIHPAADIDTYHRGNDLVGHRHGRTDSATLACVNVGHDPYLRGLKRLCIANLLYLIRGKLLKLSRKAPCSVKLSYYLYHNSIPFLIIKGGVQPPISVYATIFAYLSLSTTSSINA